MSGPMNLTPSGFGIRQKITIILLGIIMISLVFTGSLYHYKNQESIEKVVVNHLRTVANNKKMLVYQVLRKYHDRVSLIGSRTQLRLSVQTLAKIQAPEERDQLIARIDTIITDAQAPMKNIRDVVILDAQGRVISSTSAQYTRGIVLDIALPTGQKAYHIEFGQDDNANTSLFIAQRLMRDGVAIGYVVLEMNLNDFAVITNTQFGLGSTEETTLVYKSPSTGSISPIYPESLTLGYDRNTWVNPFVLVRDKDDDISTYRDHRGKEVLAVAYTFKDLNLGLVYKIDYADALGIIGEQKQFLAVASLVTALLGGIAVLLLSRTITKPIIDLTYVAAMIANGDLTQRIRHFTKDELGMLAKAFNRMADKLIDANQVLEQRVNEKTLELFQANETLAKLNRDLELLSLKDALTNIANRRAFDHRLDSEWKRCHRDQTPLALIMMDIDYFKRFNDTLGHGAGDTCLKQVAAVLERSAQRGSDLVARYGGEEFAVLLPNTALEEACAVAEKIRTAMTLEHIDHPDSPIASHVTLSMGVGAMVPESNRLPPDYLQAVDAALYVSKDKGRNAISTTQEPRSSVL
ncbi:MULTISPECIES: diguanylate cyclase domain-containing protein [Vibrio]|uniref:diguanylate cyclase domain-containing protein n=1 Tax=Vibrio TaxID=662 RepID=UPI0001B93DAD|nr:MULTISPECIES: diguanylate cyclase [Vibrio]EEX34470.1 GGDEF family protein [Vibrio coralliilyticus ATCC BAA-450]MDE3898508.1 diguanylate cyclase [Vibrio sp. CC007]